MRVAELDMTNTAIKCPINLLLQTDGNSQIYIQRTAKQPALQFTILHTLHILMYVG